MLKKCTKLCSMMGNCSSQSCSATQPVGGKTLRLANATCMCRSATSSTDRYTQHSPIMDVTCGPLPPALPLSNVMCMCRSTTPGMALYHRSMAMTQTPGLDNIWALVNGKHRAPPPRYNKRGKDSSRADNAQQQQQEGRWRTSHGGKQKARAAAAAGADDDVSAMSLGSGSPPGRELLLGKFAQQASVASQLMRYKRRQQSTCSFLAI